MLVDTTILCDALLHSGQRRDQAKNALQQCAPTELPVYAIKEFKAGALNAFIWLHNKLLQTTFSDALLSLQSIARTPKKNLVATAIQALQQSVATVESQTPEDLVSKYGKKKPMGQILAKELRLETRKRLLLAWRRRRNTCSQVIEPLSCYEELDPIEVRGGALEARGLGCKLGNCCLPNRLSGAGSDIEKLREVIKDKTRREDIRRHAALGALEKATANRPLIQKHCRDLGDAYFALIAPVGGSILTTNTKDHSELAEALGKSAIAPWDIE